MLLEGGGGSGRLGGVAPSVDGGVHLQTLPHLGHGGGHGERGLPLGHPGWQGPLAGLPQPQAVTVTGALQGLVLQRGSLVLVQAQVAAVGLLHVLLLVGLVLVGLLVLGKGQDHHAGDVSGGGPQGKVGGDHRGPHRGEVLGAGVDQILVSLPLTAASAGLAPGLHGGGLWGGEGSQVQVVLVGLDQHFAVGQTAVMHQGGEGGFRAAIFGLGLKQPSQLGHTANTRISQYSHYEKKYIYNLIQKFKVQKFRLLKFKQ